MFLWVTAGCLKYPVVTCHSEEKHDTEPPQGAHITCIQNVSLQAMEQHHYIMVIRGIIIYSIKNCKRRMGCNTHWIGITKDAGTLVFETARWSVLTFIYLPNTL